MRFKNCMEPILPDRSFKLNSTLIVAMLVGLLLNLPGWQTSVSAHCADRAHKYACCVEMNVCHCPADVGQPAKNARPQAICSCPITPTAPQPHSAAFAPHIEQGALIPQKCISVASLRYIEYGFVLSRGDTLPNAPAPTSSSPRAPPFPA